ncbi:hypothetical protein TNCV_1887931, partial [Trichonephila clavipes]
LWICFSEEEWWRDYVVFFFIRTHLAFSSPRELFFLIKQMQDPCSSEQGSRDGGRRFTRERSSSMEPLLRIGDSVRVWS